LLVIAPRLVAGLLNGEDIPPIGPQIWEDTQIQIPSSDSCEQYRNSLTDEVIDTEQTGESRTITVGSIFATLPLALCLSV